MKLVYYNHHEEKQFEIKVDKIESIEDEYVVKNVPPVSEEDKIFLSHLAEEVFILLPYNNGEDFYFKYCNHLNYFEKGDENFRVGTLISHTIGRRDPEKNFVNMFREVYRTGVEKTGVLKYLNDEGKLIKSMDFRYFVKGDSVVAIHEDKTEVRMYRESTLNDEDLGVAIVQNNRFVELNDNYASYVSKTRKQMLGEEQDLSGVPSEVVEMIFREIDLITHQKKFSYKAPIVSYHSDGKIKFYLNAEGSYTVYDNLPAVLLRVKDLTEQERAKRLIENTVDEKVRLQTTLNDLRCYSKLFIAYGTSDKEFVVSDNFYDVIEDTSRTYPFKKEVMREFILGEDLKVYDSLIASLSPTNPEIEFVTSIMTLKLNIKYIRHHIRRIYDSDGNILAFVSAHQDITEETSYAKALKKHIYEKNEIIKNKDIQIKEAHHTIKNNLNILLSLIRMEEHDNKDIRDIMDDTKCNIKAISVMHEKLYQSDTLTDVHLKKYIDSIVNSLLKIYSSEIGFVSHVDDITLNAKQAGTLGLIINELVNNTVKHAFPDKNYGNINIKVSRIDKDIEVEYRDSGVGISDSVDFEKPTSLGLVVIQNLSRQLDGKITYRYDNGSCFSLLFREKEF